jgi:hypothetical protein
MSVTVATIGEQIFDTRFVGMGLILGSTIVTMEIWLMVMGVMTLVLLS